MKTRLMQAAAVLALLSAVLAPILCGPPGCRPWSAAVKAPSLDEGFADPPLPGESRDMVPGTEKRFLKSRPGDILLPSEWINEPWKKPAK